MMNGTRAARVFEEGLWWQSSLRIDLQLQALIKLRRSCEGGLSLITMRVNEKKCCREGRGGSLSPRSRPTERARAPLERANWQHRPPSWNRERAYEFRATLILIRTRLELLADAGV